MIVSVYKLKKSQSKQALNLFLSEFIIYNKNKYNKGNWKIDKVQCLLELLFVSAPTEANGSELWAIHLKTLWNERERVLYQLKLWSVKLKFKVSNKRVEDLWKLHWFLNQNGLETPCLMHPLRLKEVPTLKVVQDILLPVQKLHSFRRDEGTVKAEWKCWGFVWFCVETRVCTFETWFHSKTGCLVLLSSKCFWA